MTWTTQLAQSYGNMTDWIEDGVNGINKVLVDAGWTILDVISATTGQTDRVYFSAGEDGTEAIYIRMIQVTGTMKVRFRMYTLWDPAAHVGYNEVKNDSDFPMTIQTKDELFTGWIVANKNGLSLAWKHTVYYGMIFIGLPNTRIMDASTAGRTTLTSGATIAASGETILAVASSDNIQIGQKIRVLNQTVGANGGNFLKCTVTGVATEQITVTNDAATALAFNTGALVGADPMPTVYIGMPASASSNLFGMPAKGAIFIYGMNTLSMIGTAIAVASQRQYMPLVPTTIVYAGSVNSSAAANAIWTTEAWSNQSPDVDGRYAVYPYSLYGGRSNDVDSTDKCCRASTNRIAFVTRGVALASEDILAVGATARWMCAFTNAAVYTSIMDSVAIQIAE